MYAYMRIFFVLGMLSFGVGSLPPSHTYTPISIAIEPTDPRSWRRMDLTHPAALVPIGPDGATVWLEAIPLGE